MLAASDGQTECVHALLSANADTTISDERGDTAADIASKKGHSTALQDITARLAVSKTISIDRSSGTVAPLSYAVPYHQPS